MAIVALTSLVLTAPGSQLLPGGGGGSSGGGGGSFGSANTSSSGGGGRPFDSLFSEYMCIDKDGACKTGAPRGPELAGLLQNGLPGGAHLVAYGPSWMREISNALVEHGSVQYVERLGENNPTTLKKCHCGAGGAECPCTDYARYHLSNGRKLTVIINYAQLQTSDAQGRLADLLGGGGFSHALVMEPHSDCFFKACQGLNACAACEQYEDNYLGCSWSAKLWETFQNQFGDRMVNVVPWSVRADMPAHGPDGLAFRTREVVEGASAAAAPCEAVPTDGQPMSGSREHVGMLHQCYAVCSSEEAAEQQRCSEGSPVLMALKVMQKLLGK